MLISDSDCTEFDRTKFRKRRPQNIENIRRPISRSKGLLNYLEDLYKKKGSVREEALAKFIDEFKKKVRYEFAQNIYVTLTHRCENSLKRGSALEIDLALQLLGLLAITVGAGDNAHEIYEDALGFLPKVLKTKSSNSIKVLECLAIVTSVGAQNSDETERSMEIIWKFIHEESESKVIRKHPPNVVASAISAWSLLLANINGWLIPYLLKKLEEDYDDNVNAACIEALGLIFENGSLEKFSDEAENYANLKDLKEDIVTRASRVTKENAEKLLEDGDKKIILTICETRLTLSTFSLVKQINYIKTCLGHGFVEHMRENEHLHNIFRFVPQTISSVDDEKDLFEPASENVVLRVFAPEIRRKACEKRISMSPSSFMSKGRTQLRNKQRMLAEMTIESNFDHRSYIRNTAKKNSDPIS
ncbi:uncharacterized protein LOC132601866 [Lycium barbarum]|uniref:uncharacterized protein LOC132601866 n=1 Tax=Lycium barbarum TaxID=112863 RepID=UPI00293ECFAA|nr:uncharacterized protein LOC132601866 [Lycium barbarum]